MQRLTSIIAMLVLAACSGGDGGASGNGGSGGGGGGTGGTGGSGGTEDPGSCEQPPSQALSQACCTAHGIDACGASLFCAAFDGRKQATCYPERSRADQQECNEDRQCMSGSCNVGEGACRSTPSTQCDPAIGCAVDPAGTRYACVVETGTCRSVGDGGYGSVCEVEADCGNRLSCIDTLCKQSDPVCGVFSGDGPCVDDPNDMLCQICRLRSYYSSGPHGCETTFLALDLCVLGTGCDAVDVACLTTSCDAELCAHEGCVASVEGDSAQVCY